MRAIEWSRRQPRQAKRLALAARESAREREFDRAADEILRVRDAATGFSIESAAFVVYREPRMQTGSHGLKRELRLRDLVPMQIAIVTYLGWIGFAAKQGATQVALWFLAILFFYLPLAVVVIKLSREIPVEGGVYQWVKTGFSPFAAYIAAWNLTIYALFAFATVGSALAEGFAHAAGPRGAWMGTNRWFAVAVMATACLIAYASTRVD